MDLVGFLALQTPTNVSSPTSLERLISSQRSGEVTFPQLFVAREQASFFKNPFSRQKFWDSQYFVPERSVQQRILHSF